MSVSDQIAGGTEQRDVGVPTAAVAEVPPSQPSSEASQAAEPAGSKEKPKRRGFTLVLVSALLAVILGLGVAIFVITKLSGSADRADIASLQQQIRTLNTDNSDIASLKTQLEKLQSQGAGNSGVSARLSSVEQSLGALSSTVSALQQSTGSTAGAAVNSQAALDDIKNQIAQLGARVETLEKSVNNANAALADRVSALEQKIPANLADQLSGAATKTSVDSLENRVAMLEASTTALDAKRAAAAIALANLVRAAQSGNAFPDEFAAVRLLDLDPKVLAPIAPYADKGVAPASEITARFDSAARDALRASRGAVKDWWGRFWANLSSLFLVRRMGPMAGTSDEAILARAGDDVHAGNFAAALDELSALSAPAAKEMTPWTADAKARVDLDRLVNNATAELLANLAQVPAHR